MPQVTLLFAMPMPESKIRGGLTYVKNVGDLMIIATANTSDTEDIELERVEFGGVNILPVLEHFLSYGDCPILNKVYEACESHLEYRRYDKDVRQENEEAV